MRKFWQRTKLRILMESIDIPEKKSLFSHDHVPIGNVVCRVCDLTDATETYLKGINKDARLYCDDALLMRRR